MNLGACARQITSPRCNKLHNLGNKPCKGCKLTAKQHNTLNTHTLCSHGGVTVCVCVCRVTAAFSKVQCGKFSLTY